MKNGSMLTVVENYFKTHSIAQHHINSFNDFLTKGIKSIVAANDRITSEIDPNFYIKYLDIRVGKPEVRDGQNRYSLTPHECRLRDMTYSAPITVTIEFTRGQEILRQDVVIGHMPIMLRSLNCILYGKHPNEVMQFQECPNDPGGYFIVNGSEKVILMQEQASKNRIFTFKNDDQVVCEVTCISAEKKSRLILEMSKKKEIMVKHNAFPREGIPVYALFKAMSGMADLDITDLILRDTERSMEMFQLLLPSIEHCHELKIESKINALEYIGKRIKLTRETSKPPALISYDILYGSVLTHIPMTNDSFYSKIIYLAFMTRRLLLCHMNPANHSDNRDFYGNKRLELAGTLIGYIFEDAFKRYNSVLTTTANRNLPKVKVAQFDVTKHMTGNMITHSLCYAIKTGNWAIRRFRINRVGVSQVLTRTSYLSMVGLLTRVNSQFEKTRKTTGPRSLQSSYWGIICPSDTPEGESCGLVKNLALMCQISTEDDDTEIYQICVQSPFVISYGAVDFDKLHLNLHYLFINGNIVGFVTNICDFTATMREHRRRGRISKYTSIYTNQYHKSVYISSDGGRLCRPYIVVNLDGVPEVTKEDIHYVQRHIKNFDDLVVEGKIEYLDMNELNDCYISPAPEQCVPGKTTHMEIELFTILGICASIIPYPHCNQSPRNTYQCAMGKQAIGLVALNQNCRNDTQLNMLQYPQYPLVQTKPMRMLDLLPAGQNPTVAVMSFSGYDLEDASVLNKSSIEFGYARCFVYKNMKTELKTYPSRQSRDILCSNVVKPDDTRNKWRLSSIEFDGMASPESVISENQIVVHKKSPDQMNVAQTMFDSGKSTSTNYHDSSMVYRNSNNSVIDKVTISNHDEEVLVKILNRQMRPPIVGDKFSSRHGQKGVVGAIFNKTLFPFTSEGISPDMVMNPHGFPSRMTVGKLKEMTASKAAALKATVHDGTIFNGTNMDDCFDIMHNHFRLHSGKELMVSGITGELMPEEIFVGPIYYQRLKHMVSDKVHSRSIGPTTSLTRQPTEGRSRDGGLRVGEMERDCLIGHGTAFSLLERFMLSSDVCEMDVCNSCNFLAAGQFCMKCNSSEDIIKVQIPYAFKLLVQELFSMGVHPAIGFKLKKNT